MLELSCSQSQEAVERRVGEVGDKGRQLEAAGREVVQMSYLPAARILAVPELKPWSINGLEVNVLKRGELFFACFM